MFVLFGPFYIIWIYTYAFSRFWDLSWVSHVRSFSFKIDLSLSCLRSLVLFSEFVTLLVFYLINLQGNRSGAGHRLTGDEDEHRRRAVRRVVIQSAFCTILVLFANYGIAALYWFVFTTWAVSSQVIVVSAFMTIVYGGELISMLVSASYFLKWFFKDAPKLRHVRDSKDKSLSQGSSQADANRPRCCPTLLLLASGCSPDEPVCSQSQRLSVSIS